MFRWWFREADGYVDWVDQADDFRVLIGQIQDTIWNIGDDPEDHAEYWIECDAKRIATIEVVGRRKAVLKVDGVQAHAVSL